MFPCKLKRKKKKKKGREVQINLMVFSETMSCHSRAWGLPQEAVKTLNRFRLNPLQGTGASVEDTHTFGLNFL